LIAANPSVTALRSAGRIHQIARQLKLGVGRGCLVLNRLNGPAEPPAGGALGAELRRLEEEGLPLLGEIPYDAQVLAHSMGAGGLLDLPEDSPALRAVAAMMAKLEV
jgi:CO dehydrogenase nickel-insertion accessory protein CooC1